MESTEEVWQPTLRRRDRAVLPADTKAWRKALRIYFVGALEGGQRFTEID